MNDRRIAPDFGWSRGVICLLGSAMTLTAVAQSLSPAKEGELAEIIVTAEKRPENLSKVPLAITALSPATLQAFATSDTRQLADLVPGLRLSTDAAATEITIRGIGSSNDSGNGDPAAAFNVDGVYLARPQASTNILYDISRIEVLRGPQGTLYGRNADAGAINVVTNKPTFDYGGDAEVEFGNYDLLRTTAAVNLPLNDTFAVRAAFQTEKHDGYISNGTSDEDTKAGRVHLLWKPDEDTSVLVSSDYARRGGLGSAQVVLLTPRDSSAPFSTTIPSNGFFLDGTEWGTTLNAEHTFSSYTATLIANHHDEFEDQRGFAGGTTYSSSLSDSRQNSVEARLGSLPGGPLVWTTGLYYFREKQAYLLNFQLPPVALYTNYPDFATTSAAAFGQVTYSVLPALRVTGGVRYTHDHKTSDDGTFGLDAFEGVGSNSPGPILTSAPTLADKTWQDVSWKVGVDGDISDDVLGYASISKGYKAGGFYSGLPPNNTYNPEKLISYATGLKATLLDRTLKFNAEAFYWDYSNYQVSNLGLLPSPPNPPGALSLIIQNAGKAAIYGLETETAWLPTATDRVDLTLSYLHATFKDFDILGPPSPTTGDFSGSFLPHAPVWSGTIGYQHTFLLGNGTLDAAARMHFETKQYLLYWYKNARSDGSSQDGYTMSDASLTYNFPGKHWRVSAYVKNVENRAVANLSTESPSQPGNIYGELDPPRTYGGSVSFTW